jgi:hypothetical protein
MVERIALLMSLMMATAACGSDGDAGTKNEEVAEPGAAPSGHAAEPGEAPSAAKAAAEKDDGWQRFEDDTYAFSVDAPMQPEVSDQPTPTVDGMVTSKVYMFSKPAANGAMMVMITRGDENATLDFDDAVNSSMAPMSGTVIEQEEIEIEGNPGREVRFSAAPQGRKAEGRMKMVVRKGTVLQALVIHAAGDQRFRADGDRFVDSFTLTAATGG